MNLKVVEFPNDRVARYKADALETLDWARKQIENDTYCAVALILTDVEGSGATHWSSQPHNMATIGHLSRLLHRLNVAGIEESEQ
jgi:hypothetical protein